jgi:hypothetical protein
MDALELNSVLFPVNVNAWELGGFGPQILAVAKSKGVARLALKALASGPWPVGHVEKCSLFAGTGFSGIATLPSIHRRSRSCDP